MGYKRASPVTYLDSTDPPIPAIHGTEDALVPYSQATLLIDTCKEAGVNARLITVSGGGHGSGGKAQDWVDANEQMVKFFDEHLEPAQ